MKSPFERVVSEHSATVLRVCRAIVGIDDADDAWSETFISALRAYPELPHNANVEAWLVTIAHRKAIDLLRARNRRAITVEALPEPTAGRGAGRAFPSTASLTKSVRVATMTRTRLGRRGPIFSWR
jgi:DNA-directed RNA polymerase specialized sigma24 family protein